MTEASAILTTCIHCGRQVSKNALTCPHGDCKKEYPLGTECRRCRTRIPTGSHCDSCKNWRNERLAEMGPVTCQVCGHVFFNTLLSYDKARDENYHHHVYLTCKTCGDPNEKHKVFFRESCDECGFGIYRVFEQAIYCGKDYSWRDGGGRSTCKYIRHGECPETAHAKISPECPVATGRGSCLVLLLFSMAALCTSIIGIFTLL